MDGIEKIGLQIGSQLVKGGAIQQGTGMALVLVLFDEHMTCDSDLPFQLDAGCRRVLEPPRPRRGPASSEAGAYSTIRAGIPRRMEE